MMSKANNKLGGFSCTCHIVSESRIGLSATSHAIESIEHTWAEEADECDHGELD
jgi:hypothetical protein